MCPRLASPLSYLLPRDNCREQYHFVRWGQAAAFSFFRILLFRLDNKTTNSTTARPTTPSGAIESCPLPFVKGTDWPIENNETFGECLLRDTFK